MYVLYSLPAFCSFAKVTSFRLNNRDSIPENGTPYKTSDAEIPFSGG